MNNQIEETEVDHSENTDAENELDAALNAPPGKTAKTFLYAFVSTPDGEKKLVGPFGKPELRTELEKLGDITIHNMIRGREQKFSAKKVIAFF